MIADRDFYKAAYEETLKQKAAVEASRDSWRSLYEAEKDRADRVQEGRIAEFEKMISAYKDQAEADRIRLGELEFQIRKLKSHRKWWFIGGAATGAVIGGYIGNSAGRRFTF